MIEHIAEQDLLLAYDNELPAERNEVVRIHARECEQCGRRWSALAELSEQTATVGCPDVRFQPEGAAVASLLAGMASAGKPSRRHWTSRPLVYANALVALAAAIVCVLLLPSRHLSQNARNNHVTRTAPAYDVDQAIPAGYVSLPFADPALPLDDAAVLPVKLSAEDLELMGVDASDTSGDGVQAEILIGMDGWPRAIRIVEEF
jgi:hypothetical protein